MPDPTYDPILTDNLQTIAELIVLKDRDQQLQWLVFLLKELESFHEEKEFIPLLNDLQNQITVRMAAGTW